MGAKPRKSKKRSNTNAEYQRQLRRTIFFLDRTFSGQGFIEELRKNGIQVEPHAARFRHDTLDPDWLAEVGEKKWIVLTGDIAIGKNALELDALLAAKVRAFALKRNDLMKESEQAKVIINSMPQIFRMLADTRIPFIAKIHSDGTVELWKTEVKFPKGYKGKKRYRRFKGKNYEI